MSSSCIWWRVVVVWLLVVLQWKKPEAGGCAASTAPPIKLSVFRFEVWYNGVVSLPLAGRGGEGRGWGGALFPGTPCGWSVFLLRHRAHHAEAKLADAIFRRKGDSSRRQDGCLYNLQSGGPSLSFWPELEPSCCQVVCPRRRRGARRRKLFCGGEDRGFDCFSGSSSEVFCVKVQDQAVISVFFPGPVRNLYPPTIF
jgi:hypothetical protein